MAVTAVRVYHPTANTWNDVDPGDVAAWEKQGWTRAKGKHIDEGQALPAGLGYVVPKAPKPAAAPSSAKNATRKTTTTTTKPDAE